MPKPISQTLVLTGALAGQTIKLNGHRFVDGKLTIVDEGKGLGSLAKYMGRSYQAFVEGSAELEAALQRDAANGERDVYGKNERPKHQGNFKVQPNEQVAEETFADDGVGSDDPANRTEGSVAGGDGHEDSGVSESTEKQTASGASAINSALHMAVSGLDPESDDAWTSAGLPAVSAVEKAYGSGAVTRKMIEEVAPGFNRAKARELLELA